MNHCFGGSTERQSGLTQICTRKTAEYFSTFPENCGYSLTLHWNSASGSFLTVVAMRTLTLYQRALTLSYCCSVAKSCPVPCDPMGCSPPGLHHLPEFAQTNVRWVGDVFSVTWGYFSLFCTLLGSLPTCDFMTWWFPELCRSSECGHAALYTRGSCSSVSSLISLGKSLLRSHRAPGGGRLCLKFLFLPGSTNCILGNKCHHDLGVMRFVHFWGKVGHVLRSG